MLYEPTSFADQVEYDELLEYLTPVLKAAGMSTINQLPQSKLYAQILSRIKVIGTIAADLTKRQQEQDTLKACSKRVDFYNSEVQRWKNANWGWMPEFIAKSCTSTYDAFIRALNQFPENESISYLKSRLDAELTFCHQCFRQLDIYNTIDHRPTADPEFVSLYQEHDVFKAWSKYITNRPAKDLYRDYGFIKLKGKRDEISDALVRGTISSRRSYSIQRILRAIDLADKAGWYLVFDTLTLADDKMASFEENTNALRDHFRTMGRKALQAEGRSVKENSSDCFQYFCVPEYGTQKGRLHFHALYLFRTLPAGTIDPNIGLRVRNRRQVDSLRNIWPYGYSMPIAVRYSGDAFTRKGWLWPVEKNGKPVPAKPPIAVGYYVAKYVNKKADTDIILKDLGDTKECNKSIKAALINKPKTLFRVRMSRGFGMSTPSMTHLTLDTLCQLTCLSKDTTPYPQILKQNAKRELRSRLATQALFAVQDGKPQTPNLLAYLRASTQAIEASSLPSFIASMTLKLQNTDISDETRTYIINGSLSPVPSYERTRHVYGSK